MTTITVEEGESTIEPVSLGKVKICKGEICEAIGYSSENDTKGLNRLLNQYWVTNIPEGETTSLCFVCISGTIALLQKRRAEERKIKNPRTSRLEMHRRTHGSGHGKDFGYQKHR